MGRRRSHKRVSKPVLSERTDEELLSRFLATGDETAFTALAERYERKVMGECMRVLHHRQDAENARQNTFLVLMRKADTLQDEQKIGNWLIGAAHREALNIRKKKKRRASHECPCADCADCADCDNVEFLEELSIVAAEVRRLPEKYRVLLTLCYWEGKSKAEIAAKLGLPEGTVSSRLKRARQLLRSRLAKFGIWTQNECTKP